MERQVWDKLKGSKREGVYDKFSRRGEKRWAGRGLEGSPGIKKITTVHMDR